jgi:sulfite reductase (ferredoxin)
MSVPAAWKHELEGRMPEAWAREIDVFEVQIGLRKQGKIDDKLFAETRLRRGVYGQRYDNGQRYDGKETQTITFPSGELTKGPMTMWDAPGMQRIKLPMGRMTIEQLEVMADLAEEYSDRILHVTTRQDIQLHFVHIEDTPDLMRRLAAVGITTREACGNSVRNITACPYAGVCGGEVFDVTPHANAMTYFLLGHDDVQDFGRKFKIAFSGCETEACGLVNFHDLGAIAKTREVDGKLERGFAVYVGGGLGSVPQEAKLLAEFCPEEELLPLSQAVSRVFARLGEKENRARARIKFLVKKLGIEEFTRLVTEERAKLRDDPRWTAYLSNLDVLDEKPVRPPSELGAGPFSDTFVRWQKTNVRDQRQPGYATAIVTLPLGDLTVEQARAIADLARKYTGDALRTTVDQNVLFRWVSKGDLPALYAELAAIGLGLAGAEHISDVTSCPGTDTCKLGTSSSRGLASELRKRLAVVEEKNPAAAELHVKCSGCFNSCGQHHVADIGFLGVSRNVNGRRVPHFQLVIGGQWTHNAASFGLAIGAVPSKRVPELVDRIVNKYSAERQGDETFQTWVNRVGKKEWRKLVDEFVAVPAYDQDASFYSDWGDPREYTIGDIGIGECAGEVVSFTNMELAAGEREVFEAQLELEKGDTLAASRHALKAMLVAARALVRRRNANVGEDAQEIVNEFRAHLFDTKLFHDPYAGGKFAQYFFRAQSEGAKAGSKEEAHQLIEEASLFVEASYTCFAKMQEQGL